MGKNKMKLPSLLKTATQQQQQQPNKKPSSSWPSWPSCHQPKTLSFRANNDTTFKTINAAFLDLDATMDMLETSESFFTVSPDSGSFLTASEEDSRNRIETVIRSLRSDRLFFEPDQTSSILESKSASEKTLLPFKDSVVLSMESQDPYVDFRNSMEEMVAAKCVNDWEGLQELLCWYLKVNGKSNHGYIVGAFVDLLVASTTCSSSTTMSSSVNNHCSPSSPLSFYSSSSCSTRCVSCLEAEDEVDNDITTATPSSSFLLEQVRQDQASSSSSN